MNRRQFARAALTYPTAGLIAAIAATIAAVPLDPATAPPVVTAVWLAAAAPTSFLTVLICDRITFHRTTNGDS